ncbi:MAG: tetratricopeptide (TPR) repeat protein [Polyangiales bacterium]|jgi:tetratricopeptide (TPR) repeat protein
MCVAGTASAQSASAIQEARTHMEEGQVLYVQGRNLEAASEFVAAYEAQPYAAFLYNAGIAYERHGDARRAIVFYERYLGEEMRAGDREEVSGRITALRQQIAALIPTPPEGTPGEVTPEGTPGEVTPGEVTPEGTPGEVTPEDTPGEVTPEGTPGEVTPGEVTPGEVTPGEVTPEGTPSEVTPEVTPGATVLVAAGPERAMKSLLSVETNPSGALVRLRREGRVVVEGPSPFNETLDEGTYEISVEHPDFQTITHEMVIRAGKVYVAVLEMSQGNFAGLLRVVTDPPGASVFVDDRAVGALGQTPFQNVVPIGTHRVWLERPGFETIEREVEVGLGDVGELSETMSRETFGRLRVIANVRGAEIFIDDELVGTTPYEGDVDAGAHELRVSADDMKDYEVELEIARGMLTPVTADLKPSVSRAGAWTTAIMGAGAIAGGTVLFFLSQDNLADLQAARDAGTLAVDDERIFNGRVLTIGSYAAFGVGAFLGLLSIYYFLRDGLPDSGGDVLEARDWALAPILSPERAGLTLEGTF